MQLFSGSWIYPLPGSPASSGSTRQSVDGKGAGFGIRRPPGEKMKNYWLIAAAVVFALIVGALTPMPRDRQAQTAKTGGESHVVRVDPGAGYDWRAPPSGSGRKF
jgi:hypothetical protein